MKLLGTALAAIAAIALTSAAWAQVLHDPMRPPGADGGADQQPDEPVLQSVIVSAGRRVAVISGRTYRTGDRLGEARVAAISANAVTLQEPGKTRVLTLLPEAVTRSIEGAENSPGRKSGAGPEVHR